MGSGASCVSQENLLAQTELLDELTVDVRLSGGQVVQEAATASDHLQKTRTGVVVLLVGLQVICQFLDALSNQSNLDLGGSGVAWVGLILLDNAFDGHEIY